MRALLDINVLIALLDADHSLHTPAIAWFAQHGQEGWASCPLTQNGCVRIMSHAAYANTTPVHAILERLGEATREPQHEFWADSISLLNPKIADPKRIHGPRQLTDIYLLALAVQHSGRFVTFDQSVPLNAVYGATRDHLLAL